MKRKLELSGVYFCGNKASDHAIEHGFLDYATFAKAFDAVLNNGIMSFEVDYWEQENGFVDNSDEIEELENRIEELEEDNDDGAKDAEIEELTEQVEELKEEQENPDEIYQYFIISDAGAEMLKDYTNEIVFYNSKMDMYVWGVTHWGTSWDYVLTDIPLNCREQ